MDEKSASAWKITLCSLAGGEPGGTLGEPGELREAGQMVVIFFLENAMMVAAIFPWLLRGKM